MLPFRAEANSGRLAKERRPGSGEFVSSSAEPTRSTMTTRPPGSRWYWLATRTRAGGGAVRPRSSVSSANVAIVSASRSILPVRSRRSLRPYWIPSGISSAARTTTASATYVARKRRLIPERADEARPHATVSIHDGWPSFLRSAATWTSMVFVPPYHDVSQTSSKIRARDTTAPGSFASSASRSNSLGVSSISRSST